MRNSASEVNREIGPVHPDAPENAVQNPAGTVIGSAPVDLRAVCFTEAERQGFPAVRLGARPSETVLAGRENWQAFTANAFMADVVDAIWQLDGRDAR